MKEVMNQYMIVLFILLCLFVSLIFLKATPAEACFDEGPVITEHKEDWSADFLWEELSKYSPNDKITAGVMGYFWRESFFRSDAIAGWPWFDIIEHSNSSLEFTLKVDEGLKDRSSYDYYIHQIQNVYGGYGLGQWLSMNYLKHFYEFVREREGSIGDAKLQCEFIFQSLQRNEKLWEMLLEDKTAFDCGLHIGALYDGTDMASTIGFYADQFYTKYSDEVKVKNGRG